MKKYKKSKFLKKHHEATKTLREFEEIGKRISPFLPKQIQIKEYPNEWTIDKPQNRWL